MKGMTYYAADAALKAAGELVSVGKVIVTPTAADGLAEFLTGGAGGTRVALVGSDFSGHSITVDLCGTQADYLNLTNAVVMVEWD